MSSTSLFPDIPAISVTLNGVIKLLQNLKPYKASGPDKIPTRLLKECAKEIAPSLVLLFQASLKQSIVPTEWKHAFVTPIFKKGDRSLASNYRPVSLTSVCGKLLEHIVYSEVMNHLNLLDILSNAQHGFCSKRSCETQLLLTVHDFASGLNDGKQTDAIILDFTKAFDKVSHKHLCTKLHYYGIRGPILDWIKDFISNRSQQVILDGCSSESLPVTSGVPQGTVLGPLLFLCFVNDIPDCVSSNIHLYADDILLYRTINVMDDCVKLQDDLNVLQQWEKRWQMHFNPSKCCYIRLSNKQHLLDYNYNIHNTVLQETNAIKYLGVHIDDKLTWKSHVDTIVTKPNSVKGFLSRNFKHCPPSVKSKCYQTLIRPVLEYASIVWSPYLVTLIDKIEAVQCRSVRFILNDYSRTSSVTSMMESLNLPLLESRRTCNRAIMMFKILNSIVDISTDPTVLVPNTLPTRGHNQRFRQLPVRTNSFGKSFFPDSIKIWNQLPTPIVNCNDLETFKLQLYNYSYN